MPVIKKVFKKMKKLLIIMEQSELKKQKTSFYSFGPLKDHSKKKLQLTIKSQSQRQINYKQPLQINKPPNIRLQFATMAKRQTSCLFPVNRNKREKKLSEIVISSSSSLLDIKRQPLASKLNEHNISKQQKGKPKFTGEAKIIEIKMVTKKGRSRQRKTLQHISSKRPPFVQFKGAKQSRSSFDLQYCT